MLLYDLVYVNHIVLYKILEEKLYNNEFSNEWADNVKSRDCITTSKWIGLSF